MCQALFGLESVLPTFDSNIPADASNYHPVDATSLQTVLINCISKSKRQQALLCDAFRESPHVASFDDGPEARLVLAGAMRAAVTKGCLPSVRRLWIVDSQLAIYEDKATYPTLHRRDIIEDVTFAIPYVDILPSRSDDTFLARLPSGKEVVSYFWAIREVVEGEAWKETINGYRLPTAAFDGRSEIGYVAKALPVRSVAAWEEKYPKWKAFVWINESKTGMRLLDAARHDGLFGTTPVRERTPEGWFREEFSRCLYRADA